MPARTLRPGAAAAVAAALLAAHLGAAVPGPGQNESWTLDFRAGLEGAGARPGNVAIAGQWRRTVVAVRPESYDVRFELVSARIGEAPDAAGSPALALAQKRLSTPFWMTFGRDGAAWSVRFPKDLPVSDRNLLQMIATESQYVQPAGAGMTWTSEERDGGGTYAALYQRLGPSRTRKKKIKYLEPGGTGQARAMLSIGVEESEAEYSFEPGEVLAGMHGLQRIRISVAGPNGKSLLTRAEIRLSDRRAEAAVPLESLKIPAGLEDVPVAAHQPDPRLAREQMDRQLVGTRRTEEILQAAVRNDPDARQRLTALFRLRPESIPLAVRSIAAGSPAATIAGALAEAGTPVAIEALNAIAHGASYSAAIREAVLAALSGVADPPETAMRIPADLVRDSDPRVRTAARLASGALARAGRKAHPVQSGHLDHLLAELLAGAASAEERKEVLAALGNSAGPAASSLLRKDLTDEHEDIRAAAARGLRLVSGDETDQLLAVVARSDQSPRVRSAALFAFGFRPLSPVLRETLLHAARADSSDAVRNRAIGLLRNLAARPPETESTLQWIERNDPSDAVRRVAREALVAIRPKSAPL